MTKFNAADMHTKRLRIGKFLYYQHCKRFLFWANDLYISVWALRINICWNRTFIWSDKTFKKFVIDIFWYNHKKFIRFYTNGTHKKYKANTAHPDRYIAEMEMENYYNTP